MTSASSRGRRRSTALLAVAALVLTSCGSDPETTPAGQDPAGPSSESSPFTVGPAPDGYRLVTAGRGTAEQEWGADSTGTDEPYTVLSADGSAAGDGVVVVSLTGYRGYQGGLAQASAGYLSDARQDVSHDGQDAVFAPAGHRPDGTGWADLVVIRDESVAVRVTSPEATRDELLAIADRVTVPDGRDEALRAPVEAPEVEVPGYEVVGSVDSAGVVGLRFLVRANSDDVPGPAAAHSAGWITAEGDELVVETLPGRAVDLAALDTTGWDPFIGGNSTAAHPATVDERSAVVIEHADEAAEVEQRMVAMESPWGDVVVVSSHWDAPTSEEDLLALAASVERTDQATWDGFVIEATGGPGLTPDEGHAEVTRGTIGELEWLLQDGPATGGILVTEPGDDPDLSQVDSCLKLSDRTRTCADGVQTGVDGTIATIDDDVVGPDDTDLGDVAIVSTPQEGAQLRVAAASEQVTVPLVEVPDRGRWAAVVFLDDLGRARCDGEAGTPPPPGSMRLDVLDASGQPTACID